MKGRTLWTTSIQLETVAGIYAYGNTLWVHDGQWQGELLDLETGGRVRSLQLAPSSELLREVLTEDALRWRLQLQPLLIESSLLCSISNGTLQQETGEFGLVMATDWIGGQPQFQALRYQPKPQTRPYARGIHQGLYTTPTGQIGFLTSHPLYDMEQDEGGPFEFSFFVADEKTGTFESVAEATHTGTNMGGAFRELEVPAGWKLHEHNQPACFDWSPTASVWIFRTIKIEATRTDQVFTIRAELPLNTH